MILKMREKKIWALLLAVILLLCQGLFPFACQVWGGEEQGRPEKQETVIRVGYPNQTGLTMVGEDGSYSGYTYEYLQEVAKYTNWKFEFVQLGGNFETVRTQMMEMLKNGELDLVGSMGYSEELTRTYDYPGYNYGMSYTILAALEGNRNITEMNLPARKNLTVAVSQKEESRQKLLDQYAQMNGLSITKLQCKTEREQVAVLKAKKADVMLGTDLSRMKGTKTVAKFSPEPFYLATTKGNSEVVSGLNMAIPSINEASPYLFTSLYEKYFGNGSDGLVLSDDDKSLISGLGTIRVGLMGGKAPIQYLEGDEVKGISVDLLDIISEKTGIQFQKVYIDTYEELADSVSKGKVDLVAGVGSKESQFENGSVTPTVPYLKSLLDLAVNKKINPGKLEGKSLALVEGYSYSGGYKGEVQYFPSIEEALKAVDGGKADYCYGNSYSAQYYRSKNAYDHLALFPQSDQWEQEMCMGVVNSEKNELLPLLNKVIRSIPEEELQDLVYSNAYQAQDMQLGVYLKSNPVLLAGILAAIFCIILTIILIIFRSRTKMNKTLATENKRYEMLAEVSGEFIYEYNYQEDTLKMTMENALLFQGKKQIPCLQKTRETDRVKGTFLDTLILEEQEGTRDVRLMHDDGHRHWYRVSAKVVRDEHNKPLYAIGKLQDIQQEKEEKEHLVEKANKDSLTGLYNASACASKVQALLEKGGGVLLIIDIDYFKKINDQYGHYQGDQVLKQLGAALKETFREDDILGRPGGDEFFVFMRGVLDRKVAEERCRALLEKARKIHTEKLPCMVTLSIGGKMTGKSGEYTWLYQEADKQLYQAKEKGRDGFCLD